jgi:hypothetical protein
VAIQRIFGLKAEDLDVVEELFYSDVRAKREARRAGG